MTDAEFHDAVIGRLAAIEGHLMAMSNDMGALKAAMHMPSDCALGPKVLRLELTEARRGGALAIVGTIAGLVAAGVVALLLKFIPGR